MEQVYRNGFCNFAASIPTNPREGFFFNRDTKLGGSSPIEFGPRAHPKKLHLFYNWVECLRDNAPLYKRGWVIQETYLSPRGIHFARFPFFECRQSLVCEAYQAKGPNDSFDWLSSTSKTLDAWDISKLSTWNSIYEYSRCQLTRQTDKLIALCGVAKHLSPKIGGLYHGGIWSELWLPGLLWQVPKWGTGDDVDTIRPHKYLGILPFCASSTRANLQNSTVLVVGIHRRPYRSLETRYKSTISATYADENDTIRR